MFRDVVELLVRLDKDCPIDGIEHTCTFYPDGSIRIFGRDTDLNVQYSYTFDDVSEFIEKLRLTLLEE